MDTEENSSDLLETVETTFLPPSNVKVPAVPEWRESTKKWTPLTPILTEYYNVIDNPKRLPTILHPLLSKERAFTFGGHKPSYHNFQVYVPDEHGVSRRLYVNVCTENFLVGAFGASLIGGTTRHFMPTPSNVPNLIAQRFFSGKPFVGAVTRITISAGMIATAICWKLAIRSVSGGLMYDMLKRSQAEKYNHDHWVNAGISGTICGLFFGIRGGLPHAWAAAAVCSGGAILSEFIPTSDAN